MLLLLLVASLPVWALRTFTNNDIEVLAPDAIEPRWPYFMAVRTNASGLSNLRWSFSFKANLTAEAEGLDASMQLMGGDAADIDSGLFGGFSMDDRPATTLMERKNTSARDMVDMLRDADALRPFAMDEMTSVNSFNWPIEDTFAPSTELDQNCITSRGVIDGCTGMVIAKSFPYPGIFTATLRYRIDGSWRSLDMDITIRRVDRQTVTRKEVRDLTRNEWRKFVETLHLLKETGIYDHFVAVHVASMQRMYSEICPECNVSHGTPAFLPWHRAYLRIFELVLQDFGRDRNVALPFWDWTIDRALDDGPASSEVWTDRYFGPNGDFFTGVVRSGPFCSTRSDECDGRWPVRADLEGPVLRREVGYLVPIVPSWATIRASMQTDVYDAPPYDRDAGGFRSLLEGWNVLGHNTVHQFVGGSMASHASPNDPVFFLHHCFIDNIYLSWQHQKNCFDDCYPLKEGESLSKDEVPIAREYRGEWRLPGQYWSDVMFPWQLRISDVASWDGASVGYKYD